MRRILPLAVFLFLITPAEAAYLDLAWDPNTEPDLAGYRIYYGTASGQYTDFVDVGDTTTYRLGSLQDGVTYYLAATAHDTSGNESDYSNEVSSIPVTEGGADVDGDGLPDDWEIAYFGDLGQGPTGDYDGDGLDNLEEFQRGTAPSSSDTDSDDLPDGWEIQYSLNPLDSSDASADGDGDGVTNLQEYLAGTDPWNAPPSAIAGPDQTVSEGVPVTLDGSNSSDPDDGIASYLWERTAGASVTLSDPSAVKPSFTAPNVGPGGTSLTFRLTVTDYGGQQSSATCIVNITWVNRPPVSNAGPDQTVNEGTTVSLDGSNSSDPDDGIASYLWEQTAGVPVSLSNPTTVRPAFLSPDVGPNGGSLTFRLTVADNGGLQSTDSSVVNITWINGPPVANAGPDQTVNEGTTVTLDGSNSSDPDDGIASYLWEQTAGVSVTLSDPTAVRPNFPAPNVGPNGGSLTFRLTVSDGGGLKSTDIATVNISWVNVPPRADAGPDQTVDEGMTVTLDGSNSSDPDDGIASYLWKQTAGTPVTLSDPTAAAPTFVTAPVGAGGAVFSFHMTVTDTGGLQVSDGVSVTVRDNGEDGFLADVITFKTPTNETMGLRVESGGNIVSLTAIDPSTIPEARNRPKRMIYGMVDMKIKSDTVGGTAHVTLYFPTAVPQGYKWYKYTPSDGWRKYQRYTVFNSSRDQVTATLVDGGIGDDDGVANGIIVDPSAFGTEPAGSGSTPVDEVKGCFISTVSRFRQ
ncbi:MAG: hypothetical protein GTN81_03695 [Proteobacteria bacterium]|nr:hypothetical protein [Pseudomonadota bacterium]